MTTDEFRTRYEHDYVPIWLAFDPAFPCIYCNRPVQNLSFGGPAICPTCDCGFDHETGQAWTMEKFTAVMANATRRFAEMILNPDPIWAEYETAWIKRRRETEQK